MGPVSVSVRLFSSVRGSARSAVKTPRPNLTGIRSPDVVYGCVCGALGQIVVVPCGDQIKVRGEEVSGDFSGGLLLSVRLNLIQCNVVV